MTGCSSFCGYASTTNLDTRDYTKLTVTLNASTQSGIAIFSNTVLCSGVPIAYKYGDNLYGYRHPGLGNYAFIGEVKSVNATFECDITNIDYIAILPIGNDSNTEECTWVLE